MCVLYQCMTHTRARTHARTHTHKLTVSLCVCGTLEYKNVCTMPVSANKLVAISIPKGNRSTVLINTNFFVL